MKLKNNNKQVVVFIVYFISITDNKQNTVCVPKTGVP